MNSCDDCDSERILELNAKCSDRCSANLGEGSSEGYAPRITGICGGDYINPSVCMDCGKVQGEFPKETPDELKPVECIECGGTPDRYSRRPSEAGDGCEDDSCHGFYDLVEVE